MVQDHNMITLSDGVSYQPLGESEGAVVLLVESGQLYKCNDTSSAFLAAIDGQCTFSDVVSRLLQAFDVKRDELRNDLAVPALELQQEGIIWIR